MRNNCLHHLLIHSCWVRLPGLSHGLGSVTVVVGNKAARVPTLIPIRERDEKWVEKNRMGMASVEESKNHRKRVLDTKLSIRQSEPQVKTSPEQRWMGRSLCLSRSEETASAKALRQLLAPCIPKDENLFSHRAVSILCTLAVLPGSCHAHGIAPF